MRGFAAAVVFLAILANLSLSLSCSEGQFLCGVMPCGVSFDGSAHEKPDFWC